MNCTVSAFITLLMIALASCSNDPVEEKGFPVSTSSGSNPASTDGEGSEGVGQDSTKFFTRPSNVLLTGLSNIRLATIYKVSFRSRDSMAYIGTNNYLYDNRETEKGNNWNGNLIPGLEGIYGFNLINISHYDIQTDQRKNLFSKPVLIKTLYYPSFSKDSLNGKPVKRNYLMVSVYDADTNKDGFINTKDLRRFYLFDSSGVQLKQLVPPNYSVYQSEYDSDNDLLFVFARLDKNGNGRIEDVEPTNIFWVDLKNPIHTGQQY